MNVVPGAGVVPGEPVLPAADAPSLPMTPGPAIDANESLLEEAADAETAPEGVPTTESGAGEAGESGAAHE